MIEENEKRVRAFPFVHIWTVREGYLQRLRAFTDTALLARALAKG